MASVRLNLELEPGHNWPDAALDTPKPLEPCSICQDLVDFLSLSCTWEEPDDCDSTACVLATWSTIQHNNRCPTCREVVKKLLRLGAGESCTEDAHVRILQPWEGSFVIKLRRDCQDKDKDIGFSLSPLGDDIPWAGYFSGVLVDASWIDIKRIKKWLNRCNSSHDGVCCNAPGMAGIHLPDVLYLLDVEKQCITVADGIPKYVALSYVWAHAPSQYELKKETLSFMKQPGSLTSENAKRGISRTVRVAMELAQRIGVRFLWVDRLCIIQNDPLQKAEQINAMGAIDFHSYLTLAVADSDDSNTGLRGIEGISQPRHCPQTVYTFDASPNSIAALPFPLVSPVTIYNTRGWTFQEQMLARRVLKFTVQGIQWICQSCFWREQQVDCQFPLSGWNSCNRNMTYTYTNWPNVKLWDNLLQEYLERHLTYEDDILRAFTGIIEILSNGFPGSFHFGLPELFFDAALLWRPRSFIERRISNTGVAFPSWSWCGWKGKIFSGINGFGTEHIRSDPMIKDERGQPIISFPLKFQWKKTRVDQRKVIDVYNLWHVFRDDTLPNRFDPAKPLPPGWSLKQPEEGAAYYTHQAALGHSFYYPIPTTYNWENVQAETWGPVLQRITLRVFLNIGEPLYFPDDEEEEEDKDHGSDRFGMFSLVDSHNEWVGVLHVNLEPTNNSQILGESCELIMLSSGLARNDCNNDTGTVKSDLPELASNVAENIPELYEFKHVMWIEWKEKIAYRKGIGRVLSKVFQGDEYVLNLPLHQKDRSFHYSGRIIYIITPVQQYGCHARIILLG